MAASFGLATALYGTQHMQNGTRMEENDSRIQKPVGSTGFTPEEHADEDEMNFLPHINVVKDRWRRTLPMRNYGPTNAKCRVSLEPPEDTETLHRINYGTLTSQDLQFLDKTFDLTTPPNSDDPHGRWEKLVDSAILTDFFHALYGQRHWRDTELYTKASGKYPQDMRETAMYLDYNEQVVLNKVASYIVYYSHEVSKLQPNDSPTENLCNLFDLAINFILYLAAALAQQTDADHPLTSMAYLDFMQVDKAYTNGKGLIFKQDSPQAREFLLATYSMAMSCNPQRTYGGHTLHQYMGPRRMFGRTREHALREEIFRVLGLAALIKESKNERFSGPLDELTASYIHSGPFKIEMSDRIQDHLTFQIDGRIILYDINKFDYLAFFRNCLAEGLGLHEFGVELWKTYLLLFARDDESTHMATTKGVNISVLRTCRFHIFPTNVPLQLEDFPFFQHRLHLIQEKMDEWRPQSVKQLFTRGYRDPINYYTFVTAIFFGVLGIVGVAAGIVQAYASF